ncbi:MAG: hypothetical protein HZB76_03435 [Chlamydiae bacterium]|nr:hypothetical protein [Chlamydiota bacterium]
MRCVLSLMLFWLSLANADSVKLLNDSPYELTAIVQGANGMEIGQQTMQPGEQAEWVDDKPLQLDVPYDASVSLTPYTVVWKCPYQGIFSICINVSPGSQVAATTCPGMHYCIPKPKKENAGASSYNDCK